MVLGLLVSAARLGCRSGWGCGGGFRSEVEVPAAAKAELAWLLFPIEPIRRVWISLRPESRADPPTVSVHFPAAAERGI